MSQQAKALDWSDDRQLQEAKTVVDKLILAAKNTAFYPINHSISQKSITELYHYISGYTRNYGALVLEMGKGEILFQGQRVYLNPDLQNNPAYLCFRDGLKWLSFSEGMEQKELVVFLDILKNQGVLEEESKGDIVTCLWEAELPNIKYRTNNAIWKNEKLIDLQGLKITDNQNEQPSEESAGGFHGAEETLQILDGANEEEVLGLLPEEVKRVYQLVEEEENRDFDQDVFDVLLVILKEQRESEDFATVLDIIKESFKRTIAQGEFLYAAKFLAQLRQVRQTYQKSGTWALAHLDDFLLTISGPQVLSILNDALPGIKAGDYKKKKSLEKMLYQLRPESTISIGQMLPRIKDNTIITILVRVIKHHASNDTRPLIHLARHTAPAIRKTAIFVMGYIPNPDVIPVITEATRSTDFSLRKTAVQALSRKSPPLYDQLLPFIKDQKAEIRETVFSFLAQKPDQETETAILNYLAQSRFKNRHRPSLLLLYQALGHCRGDSAQAYLSHQLLANPWHIGRRRGAHRLGAAMALMITNNSDAQHLLRKASKSMSPPIRRAVRNAEEMLNARSSKRT
ncbi:MAG: HEAT repeat domain-containing protein [Desulfobacterales bacterium]|nr:HEAT repeat domain-containing protein [Desulfobacterales bacterium]